MDDDTTFPGDLVRSPSARTVGRRRFISLETVKRTGVFGRTVAAGASCLFCAMAIAACGGPTSTSESTGLSLSPGDKQICELVAKASTAYGAKKYEVWRNDMVQVGKLANFSEE